MRTILATSLPPWHCHGRGGTALSGHIGLKYRLAGSRILMMVVSRISVHGQPDARFGGALTVELKK